MAIRDRIKPKIQKAINKLPTEGVIKRNNKNEFGEPDGEEVICNVIGLYHESGDTSSSIQDKGITETKKQFYLMLVYDDNTKKIKRGDTVYMHGKKYVVIDTGNVYMLNAYLDMKLRLVKENDS